jgi:glycosyltransferase involved in cell wall biosynthesis
MGHTEQKVALLHYWLTNMRGGENVLTEFCRMFPSADIFTHAYNPAVIDNVITSHQVHTSFIGKLPRAKVDCQKYLPLMPAATRKLDIDAYDLIISSESGPIKGIRKPQNATHVCYCHTPMRYLWDMYDDYYHNTNLAGKIAMRLFTPYLRSYDLKSADSVDHFIANSHFVAERIKRIYGRDASVIHPPVNTEFFSQGQYVKRDYYLFVGQLIPYKRPDLAIAACQKLNRPLVIVGDGPLRKKLQKQACGAANITFVDRRDHENLRKLYAEAKALLFPGVEDFGIVPLEAQAAGTPVIALGKGGALETIVSGKTGLFFKEATEEALSNAIEEFEALRFEPDDLKQHAAKFNPTRFRNEISSFLTAIEFNR